MQLILHAITEDDAPYPGRAVVCCRSPAAGSSSSRAPSPGSRRSAGHSLGGRPPPASARWSRKARRGGAQADSAGQSLSSPGGRPRQPLASRRRPAPPRCVGEAEKGATCRCPTVRSIPRFRRAGRAAPSARLPAGGGSTFAAAPSAAVSAAAIRHRPSTPVGMRQIPVIPSSRASSRARIGSGTTRPRSISTAPTWRGRVTTRSTSPHRGRPAAYRETGSGACTDLRSRGSAAWRVTLRRPGRHRCAGSRR